MLLENPQMFWFIFGLLVFDRGFASGGDVPRENINNLVIRSMQQQMKTMETSIRLVQASCGKNSFHGAGKVIAFHAKLKNSIKDVKSDAKIVFDDVELNECNGYNNQTGVFTSPLEGIYVFESTIQSNQNIRFNLDFMVNGKVFATTLNGQPRSGQSSVSSSVVVKLKKGCNAWLEPHSNSVGQQAYREWTYLSGFKL